MMDDTQAGGFGAPGEDPNQIEETPERKQAMLNAAEQHLQLAKKYAQAGKKDDAAREMHLSNASLPIRMRIDDQTGKIRDNTWWESHGDEVIAIASGLGGVFGAYYLNALSTSGVAVHTANVPLGTGVGIGETGATVGPPTGAITGTATGAGSGGGILSKLAQGGKGSALTGLSDVLGGAAKGQQQAGSQRDQLKVLMENTRLNRDKFALDAPKTRLKSSILASLAGNFKPTTVDWGPGGFHPGIGLESGAPPTFKGGFAEGMANLDPRTKQQASTTIDDELQAQLSGGATGGNTDRSTPNLEGVGEDSTGESWLGGASLTSGILAALARAYGR